MNISKPEVTPLSALKVNVPVNSARYTVPAPIKTSLAVNKGVIKLYCFPSKILKSHKKID